MPKILVFVSFWFLCALAIAAQPCLNAMPECTRWVKLGGESRSLVYSTYPLDKKNEKITRALIVVHGQGRDADNYFRTTLAATFLASALEDTIAISPRFASNSGGCRDTLAVNEVNWPCGGDSWRSGGVAINDAKLTSYDFMDAIVRALAEALGKHYTRLGWIVLAGALAGCAGGFLLSYYGSAVSYPLNIGGKPFNSWQAFIPVVFECTILAAAFSAVLCMLGLNGLPQPYHPVFNVPAFGRASTDRFFLCIEATDPRFDRHATWKFLEGLHPVGVSEVAP